MNIGDRVRLKAKPSCEDALGLHEGQVGIVKDVDATCDKTSVLISFDDADVYTSALQDEDVEVLQSGARGRPDASDVCS